MLQPLDFWPEVCEYKSMENKGDQMQGYNGWANWETWNVALWLQNDEGLYNTTRECGDYQTFVEMFGEETATPDGVCYGDPKVNVIELNSEVFDF